MREVAFDLAFDLAFDYLDGHFQALRYDKGGMKCVVQGPIEDPRNIHEEKTFQVDRHNLALSFGTPVICHGLVNAKHLNGKIADMRSGSWDEKAGCHRYQVHFEDSNLKPCSVKDR